MTAGGRADDVVDIRRRFAGVPDRLAAAAKSAVGRPVAAGEWSPSEVVRHLIAVEDVVWLARLGQLAADEKPIWPWVEPGPWQGQPEATLDELVAMFAALRTKTVASLDGFDEAGWSRTGIHATWGEVDGAALIKRAIDHDEEHIASLVAQ